MKIPDIIIAVDGYSSAGKSTFARSLAAEFGFFYIDSGALYRCVTLFALENGFIHSDMSLDEGGLSRALPGLDLVFTQTDNMRESFLINGRPVGDLIRSLEISNSVSQISSLAFVRDYVNGILQPYGKKGRIVMDGRDIGTHVFPNAQLKIFMATSLEVRSRRRYEEQIAKGENVTLEEVAQNLSKRDYLDSHREISPLVRAEDSYLLDNGNMTVASSLAWVKGLIQGKFGILE